MTRTPLRWNTFAPLVPYLELYWRGYLGSQNAWPVAQDGLFSGYHLIVLAIYISLPWLGVAFLLLAFAAWLWRQSFPIWPPISP